MAHEPNEKQAANKAHPHLFGHTLKGVQWVFAMRMTAQVLSVVRLIVLSWFLAPGDFGLMGIALVTLALLETFTETGFVFALVQKPRQDDIDLDTAWSIALIRGILIFVAVYLAAPLAVGFFSGTPATAYGGPKALELNTAVWVVRAFAFTIILRSVSNIGIVLFRREMQFNKLFVIDTTGLLVDVAVAVVVAVILRSVWALVFGKLACECVRAVMSYAMHPYRPSFRIDRSRSMELWGFGKWIFWSTVLYYFLSQGDSLVVGRLIGVAALGLYQMAVRIASLPSTEITNTITQVTFPAYSKIQDDIPRIRDAYLKVLKSTALLSCPLAGLIAVFADDFVRLFLKPEWLPIIPVIQLLAVNGLVVSIGSTSSPVFQAIGRPRTTAKLQFVKFIFLVIAIFPLTLRFGINGTAMAMLIATIALQPLVFGFLRRSIGCSLLNISRVCGPPLALTGLMVGAAAILKLLWHGPSLPQLGVQAIIACAVYLTGLLIFDAFTGSGMLTEARQFMSGVLAIGNPTSTSQPDNKDVQTFDSR